MIQEYVQPIYLRKTNDCGRPRWEMNERILN